MHGSKDSDSRPVVQTGLARVALGALALFILYGSSGPWAGDASRAAELPGVSLPDIGQNVLLYIPFGIFGVWALRGTYSTRAALTFSVVALASVYSALMEWLQLLLAARIASPLDIASNVAGALAGTALANPSERAWAGAVRHLRRTGFTRTPARFVLVVVLASIVVTAWYPFDVTLDISTLSERTRVVRRDPWLRTTAAELWLQGARYGVLAATAVFCLPKLARWATPVAFVCVLVIAVVVDAGQLGMGSRPIGLVAFAAQAVGAFAGAVAALLATLVRDREYAAA